LILTAVVYVIFRRRNNNAALADAKNMFSVTVNNPVAVGVPLPAPAVVVSTPPVQANSPMTPQVALAQWMAQHGLADVEKVVAAAGVKSVADLRLFTDADLAGLGLPLIARNKLAAAIKTIPADLPM
jgi:hypothetical protein